MPLERHANTLAHQQHTLKVENASVKLFIEPEKIQQNRLYKSGSILQLLRK